jgi:hypothetical protein
MPGQNSIPRHPKKEVNRALQLAKAKGWVWRSGAHWGVLTCPHGHPECRISVNGTPRIPELEAKRIIDRIEHCDGSGNSNDGL